MRAQELAAAYREARAGSPGAQRVGARALGDALVAALERARATWPSLRVDAVAWARHVGAHAPDGIDDEEWLSTAAVADLYVALACATGDSDAVAMLEERYFGAVRAALAGTGVSSSEADEVLGLLRARLFVGSGGIAPRIGTFSGRGPLSAWLKIAAVRIAVSEHRAMRASRERSTDEEVLERLAPAGSDPELAYLRARYQPAFEDAVKQALATLTPRQRTLLRLFYVDGVRIEKLGTMSGVHGSTVSRWISRARAMLLRETSRLVRAALPLSDAEYDSLLRVVRSDLHVSLSRVLPARESDGAEPP